MNTIICMIYLILAWVYRIFCPFQEHYPAVPLLLEFCPSIQGLSAPTYLLTYIPLTTVRPQCLQSRSFLVSHWQICVTWFTDLSVIGGNVWSIIQPYSLNYGGYKLRPYISYRYHPYYNSFMVFIIDSCSFHYAHS